MRDKNLRLNNQLRWSTEKNLQVVKKHHRARVNAQLISSSQQDINQSLLAQSVDFLPPTEEDAQQSARRIRESKVLSLFGKSECLSTEGSTRLSARDRHEESMT